jgi:sulfatase maturation enzyme AslB (radical SAM superfamily)
MIDTDCLAAKHNLFLDTSGEIKLCCNSNQSLDFESSSYGSALNGNKAKEIQFSLNTNQQHPNCQRCWKEQEQTNYSYRHAYNSMYPEFAQVGSVELKTIHIQNDNTCNLACVYCGPEFSSKWAQIRGKKEIFRQPMFFSDHNLAKLHTVTLAGGEPSLIKSNVDLLARLFEVNPDCQVIINTNLSNIDSNLVFEKFFKFKNSTVIASFEDVESRYEYIRDGSTWEKFSKNFASIVNRVRTVQASMILFPLSIGGIHNAIDFALKYIPPTEVYINDYHGNRYVWDSVSATALHKLRNKLKEYANCQHSAIQQQLLSRMDSIVSTQSTTILTSYIDKPKQENHIRLFPELYI